MKSISVTALALLLTAGYAGAAQQGAPLDDAACQAVWSEAAGSDKDLSADKAKPYVVKITLVDANGDGRISDLEWKRGCAAGQILSMAQKMDEDKSGAN
jgi:hypothetical protein